MNILGPAARQQYEPYSMYKQRLKSIIIAQNPAERAFRFTIGLKINSSCGNKYTGYI
jgi:hypothetical protein